MNERDKIIEILRKEVFEDGAGERYCIHDKAREQLADALLANGIGDVAEWKRRAEVAERNDKIKDRALDKATELAYEYRTEADTLSCSSCPMFHIFDSCKDRGLYKDCSKRWKEEILRQAEREIEEEERR